MNAPLSHDSHVPADRGARRPLPGLLILGAPKAGTTTLAAWWDQHPRGYTAPEKEVGFFTVFPERGLDWYRSRFAGASAGQVGCDASPGYLYDDAALDRIARTLPEVRLAVVLREPVSRMWSHWCYNVALGVEPRSFRTVLRQELTDENVTPPSFPLGYLKGSRYLPRLEAVAQRFARDQLLVLFTDELRADPVDAFARLCEHVGVPTVAPPDGDVRNVGMTARSRRLQRLIGVSRNMGVPARFTTRLARWNLSPRRQVMNPEHRRLLELQLHPELPALSAWLGRPLPPAWSASASR